MDLAKELVSFDAVKDQWRLFLAVIFLVFLLVERIGSLRSIWINYRLGRDELSLEKQRLEIEKLKYEIAAIKKAHALKTIEPAPVPEVPHKIRAVHAHAAPEAAPPWAWQRRFPFFSVLLARLGQGLLGFLGFVFGLSGLVSPFMVFFDEAIATTEWPFMWLGALLNLFLAYGCYRGYRRLQRSVLVVRSLMK